MSDGHDDGPSLPPGDDEESSSQPQEEHPMPPGQAAREGLQVRHYGPVPKVRDPGSWAMNFGGVTHAGSDEQLTVAGLADFPQTQVVADLHCAGKWTTVDNTWEGVLTRDVIERFPPAAGITHVMAYG